MLKQATNADVGNTLHKRDAEPRVLDSLHRYNKVLPHLLLI